MPRENKTVNKEVRLFNAIEENKADTVDYWLKKGANPIAINAKGDTPLDFAITRKRYQCIKPLLPYIPEKISGVALLNVLEDKKYEIAKLMIKKGCVLERAFQVKNGYYPLHLALTKDQFSIVRVMLEHKANPSIKTIITAKNSKEITPLELAVQNNQPHMIRILLEAGAEAADISIDGESLIAYAAHLKFWDCVKLFLEHSKLKQTFNDKDVEIVCYYAVLSNETKIAKPLITKDILKNNGPFCVNTGLRPLHVAVNKKNFTLVKAILEHKANPDCKTELTETNKKEITPLQLAIQSNQPEMIKILLDANADVNLIMDNKESPAAYAAELEFWDCVTELIYHPKCQLTQEELAKLLCHAVGQNQTSMVELLLDKKAPPQKRYFIFSGYFPLHRAVEHNNIAMVNNLLEKKADLLLKTKALDRKQETCLDIALQKGHPEMINFLLEKGELKKQKMDECFADILSYRAAFAAMTRCLSEFKISQTNVLSYIEQKKDHPNYFLLLLSSFLYLSNNKTSPVDCLFEDIKYEGQIYIAEALLEIFINAAESHHEYYQTLPEVCRKICTPKVLDIKNNQAQFGAVDLTNLFLFKNSNIKIVKSKKENLHSFTQNKTLIHRVAIVNDIRDRIRLNTYDPIHIESQLKLTYGEDIFYTSFFNRNPLLTYVRQLSIAFKKLDSKSIRKDAIRPPEYNPEYPLDEPGAINHNAYFNMNLFPANPNEIEGKEEEQIEGQPNLKPCHASSV